MIYLKKQIIVGIAVIACAALCAVVWPRTAEVRDLPAEPVKAAVIAEIEARSAETQRILLSDAVPAPIVKAVAESEPLKTKITAEEKTKPVPPAEPISHTISKSVPASSEPKPGDRAVIDGKPHIWVPGFGWIVDESGGSVGTTVGNPRDELTGNKVRIMGVTVGSDDDINKQVGIIGGGTVAQDMYENGQNMGGDDSVPSNSSPPPSVQPEPTGNVIYIEFQPPVTKDSTPLPYKPGEAQPNP